MKLLALVAALVGVGLSPAIARETLCIPSEGCYKGVFPGHKTVFDVERAIGGPVAIVLMFIDRWGPLGPFPKRWCEALWATGYLPMITWQPQTDLDSVIAGKWDELILSWAEAAKDYGHPVMINWGHEMNGTWYPWSGVRNGGGEVTGYGDPRKPDGPERYIDAYRRVRTLFDAAGADNVIWIWSPAAANPIGKAWNDLEQYYPGDEYVDWLGVTGYNWGTSRPWSRWQTFDRIFAEAYERLVALAPGKPIIISEFATSESGGDKAHWITDAFTRIKEGYPQIKAFVWFDIIKETDWALASSPDSLAAFRKAMADPYYRGRPELCPAG